MKTKHEYRSALKKLMAISLSVRLAKRHYHSTPRATEWKKTWRPHHAVAPCILIHKKDLSPRSHEVHEEKREVGRLPTLGLPSFE
jgi:hypothetical protein